MGSHEVSGKGSIKTENSQMASFQLHISHKAVKSMVKLTSQSCGGLQLAFCLPRGDDAIYRPPENSWISDKPQKQATAKAAWETFSINI